MRGPKTFGSSGFKSSLIHHLIGYLLAEDEPQFRDRPMNNRWEVPQEIREIVEANNGCNFKLLRGHGGQFQGS